MSSAYSARSAANPSFRAAVVAAGNCESLAGLLLSERRRLRDIHLAHPQGKRACRSLSTLTDVVIQRMLSLSLPRRGATTGSREETMARIAIVATGGYGRREMCPYSDIDVTFIVSDESDSALEETIRRMFLSVMEVFGQRAGLKVGYGYRTLSDVGHLDHQTQTALLDLRVVAGSHQIAERFREGLFRQIWPAVFVRQKVQERRAAVEKHGNTVFRIEPELRESPGGLRDLHLAEWLASVSFPTTRGDVWRQLQRLGVVSHRDVRHVMAAKEFLLLLRTWMHWHTGRRADLLVRERQEALADALGYQDDAAASRVERFMEQFYAHAETIHRMTEFVVDRCLSERLSLSDELVCMRSEILPAYPWVEVATPRFLVELARYYQELGLAPGYDLRRMIAQHIENCPDLSVDAKAAEDFVSLLNAPAPATEDHTNFSRVPPPRDTGQLTAVARTPGVYDTLRLLAELGVLQRLIPELGEAWRRVPFDPVHQHTIGFHSLEVTRSLERLRSSSVERESPFRHVWHEVDAPALLYLSALLHDVGKVGPPGTDHSEVGAEMARVIGRRLQLDPAAASRVETLIRHHLLMSETAQLRDLTLDKTISDFSEQIASLPLLNMLLLLTYADLEATGVMSPMKLRFLTDLYFRTEARLTGGAPPANGAPEMTRRFRSRLSRRLSTANLTPEQIREHTDGMPVAYLLNTRPEQIALHIRMVEALRSSGPVVEFDQEMGSDITTLMLCIYEQPEPGLLSKIAGVLYAHEVRVHGAQVFTREGEPSIALDTLWVDYHGRAIPPLKRLELAQDLVSVLKGEDVKALISRYRKQLPTAAPPREVRLDNSLAERHTVLEIEADDQPGLLYRITRTVAELGWNIRSARITTRGDFARDAFYITGRNGGKLEGADEELLDAFLTRFRG